MTKKIILVLAVAACLAACNHNTPDDPAEQAKEVFAKATYFEALGTNSVPNVEGANKDLPFIMDSVRAEAKIVSDTTLNLYLYGITFSSKMPVTIDMVIPDAKYTRTATKITISGENIAPTMGGNPVARYMITGLNGFITADSLCFSNNYGTYQNCTYAGKVTKMEK